MQGYWIWVATKAGHQDSGIILINSLEISNKTPMATAGWCVLTLSLLALLSLSVNADDCSPNPCKNGGNCLDLPFGQIACFCPHGYVGKYCQYPKGRLRVLVKTGANPRDRDGTGLGTSDPYVKAVASDHLGNKKTRLTKTDYTMWAQNSTSGWTLEWTHGLAWLCRY